MQATLELDSTVKNVVQEIMRECTNRGIQISDSFVIYFVSIPFKLTKQEDKTLILNIQVKLLMLDPTWGITSGSLPNRNDVQNFVKHCLHRLENQSCPCIITLKMQLYFMSNFDNIEHMVMRNRTDLKTRLSPLEKEVVETQTDVKEDMDKLYKKIVYLVTLYSGLGNPTVKSVSIF